MPAATAELNKRYDDPGDQYSYERRKEYHIVCRAIAAAYKIHKENNGCDAKNYQQ